MKITPACLTAPRKFTLDPLPAIGLIESGHVFLTAPCDSARLALDGVPDPLPTSSLPLVRITLDELCALANGAAVSADGWTITPCQIPKQYRRDPTDWAAVRAKLATTVPGGNSGHSTGGTLPSPGEDVTLTRAEFDALPEYSTSIPTGTTIGKRWKRNMGNGVWWMGSYAEHPDPKLVSIVWNLININP
jgi:hypothetical protein